jgi:hypothetical protein
MMQPFVALPPLHGLAAGSSGEFFPGCSIDARWKQASDGFFSISGASIDRFSEKTLL